MRIFNSLISAYNYNPIGCGLAIFNQILCFFLVRPYFQVNFAFPEWTICPPASSFLISLLNFPSVELTNALVEVLFNQAYLGATWEATTTYAYFCWFSIDVIFVVFSTIQWYLIGLLLMVIKSCYTFAGGR